MIRQTLVFTSAPRPRRKPSANLELVLWKTQAESTAPRNFSAVSWSSVTITSVWLDPYLLVKAMMKNVNEMMRLKRDR